MHNWRAGLRWLLVVLGTLGLLGACGASDDQAPVERVKGFVAAAEARDVDAMITFLPPDQRRDAAYQLRQALSSVQSLEYRQPSYTLKDNDGTTAHVQVVGQIVAQTNDGQSVEQLVDQVLTLVKQDGEWYINGSEVQLPPGPR